MAEQLHKYEVCVSWTGDLGQGTSAYTTYSRSHAIAADHKPAIAGSSDPAFRGDRERWNPEKLLVGAVSACHQLWYLHLCAAAGVVVRSYEYRAEGSMNEEGDGSGQFDQIALRPRIFIEDAGKVDLAQKLHTDAHEKCFIARSLKCEVFCFPEISARET
jgi:organic hydroperoxide reductase OsmC/OhrA